MGEVIPFSDQAKALKPGLYEHYKHNMYRVVQVARHSETYEELVVYQRVETGDFWVRPLKMFVENVEVDGVIRPRFRYVGE